MCWFRSGGRCPERQRSIGIAIPHNLCARNETAFGKPKIFDGAVIDRSRDQSARWAGLAEIADLERGIEAARLCQRGANARRVFTGQQRERWVEPEQASQELHGAIRFA